MKPGNNLILENNNVHCQQVSFAIGASSNAAGKVGTTPRTDPAPLDGCPPENENSAHVRCGRDIPNPKRRIPNKVRNPKSECPKQLARGGRLDFPLSTL
jgi:hypothetical protein